MKHVGYKAPGSLPGAHETLIPFTTTRQQIFFRCCATGRKRLPKGSESPWGVKGGRGGRGKTTLI